MTDAARYNFIRFRRSIDPNGRKLQRGSAFEYARLLEARTIAAAGLGCGYFAAEDAATWLRRTDPEVADAGPVSAAAPLMSTELLAMAEAIPADAARQQSFQETLLLRHALDNDERAAETASVLIFATEGEWEAVLGAAQRLRDAGFGRGTQSDRLSDVRASTLVDGAVSLPVLALDALACAGVGVPEPAALWADFEDDDRRYPRVVVRGVDGLRKGRDQAPPAVAAATRLLSSRRRVGKNDFAASVVVREAILVRLWEWALLFQPGSLDETLATAAAMLPDVLPPMFALASDMDLSWSALLWRVAPGDHRSRSRARELSDIAHQLISDQSDRRL